MMDHGIGMLTYATWFDTFNMFQLFVQVVALFEGYVEHKLICTDREAECIMLNKVCTPSRRGLRTRRARARAASWHISYRARSRSIPRQCAPSDATRPRGRMAAARTTASCYLIS